VSRGGSVQNRLEQLVWQIGLHEEAGVFRDVGRTLAGHHHDIQSWKPAPGEVSEFNARRVAGKIDIGYQRPQFIPGGS
jgi:hypothetical protein